MLRDKNGKRVKTGDLIQWEGNFLGYGPEILRVRWHGYHYGWVAERLTGNPTPQCIQGLSHRFVKLTPTQRREAEGVAG